MYKSNTSFNVLYTTDVILTKDFYEKLGAEIKQYESTKVVVGFGSFDLHFILNTTEPFEEYTYITVPTHYGQGIIFYIEVENIQEAKQLVSQSGGKLMSEIFQNEWHHNELLFEDPNGYKFAFYQEI